MSTTGRLTSSDRCPQTRAGVPFSPWHSRIGVPLHAPADFLLHRRMRVAFQAQEERLAALATDPGIDPDDPTVTTPDSYAQSQSTTVLPPPSDAFPPLAPDAPLAASDETAYDDTVTKAGYHRRKHKKEARRRKRAAKQDPGMNRPMKSGTTHAPVSVIVIPPDSNALHAPHELHAPSSSATFTADDQDTCPRPCSRIGEPIISPMSLEFEEQSNVTKSAFLGIRMEPTEAELAAQSREDFEAMGFNYHEWDGKCVPLAITSAPSD